MPAEGLDWLPRVAAHRRRGGPADPVAVERLGVREVRFTGGEPLVRRGLVDIVRRTAALEPRPETSLTTNALGLARTARALAEAGPRPGQRQPRHRPLRDVPRDHPARPVRRRGRRPRGGPGRRARPGQGQRRAAARRQRRPGARAAALVPGARLRAAVHRADAARRPARLEPRRDGHRRRDPRRARASEFVLLPAEEPRGSAPAELFLVDGGPATVGIIASVTRPFCGACDRVRLTADGQVRNCLFAREESDLRSRACAPARPTRSSPSAGWPRWPPRSPATASTTRRSSSPTGRCPPSGAELPGAPVQTARRSRRPRRRARRPP